jgi:hypothetical protein
MSAERDVADLYAFVLRKYASEHTARAAAMARELMSGADDYTVREAVSRAMATARIKAREATSEPSSPVSAQHVGLVRDRPSRR